MVWCRLLSLGEMEVIFLRWSTNCWLLVRHGKSLRRLLSLELAVALCRSNDES